MELRAVTEALNFISPNMVVWVASDSKYVKNGIAQWIHNWKRSGWGNSKKKCVASETLWGELDTDIARGSALSSLESKRTVTLFNEYADQMVSRAVGYGSHGPEIVTPPDGIESGEESVMGDDDITQLDA
jgi:ribonuclease HI